MSKKMRLIFMHDKFRCDDCMTCSWNWKNIPQETQQHLYEVFGKFMESILDIDYMEVLPINDIYEYYVSPLVDHAFRVENAKLHENTKIENNSGYGTLERKMNDPEMRSQVLKDLLRCYVVIYYDYQQIPQENQQRLYEAFGKFIDSIVEIDYMELLSINHICSEYLRPMADQAFETEKAKLWDPEYDSKVRKRNKISNRRNDIHDFPMISHVFPTTWTCDDDEY